MFKISHRGNLFGKNESIENSPEYVYDAISKGFDVEVDFRVEGKKMFLGHDFAQYEIDKNFLDFNIKKLWLHCKNLEALDFVLSMPKYYKAFWHQEDSYTITTNHYIWTYPKMPITEKSILVHCEMPTRDILSLKMAGICSDYVGRI